MLFQYKKCYQYMVKSNWLILIELGLTVFRCWTFFIMRLIVLWRKLQWLDSGGPVQSSPLPEITI